LVDVVVVVVVVIFTAASVSEVEAIAKAISGGGEVGVGGSLSNVFVFLQPHLLTLPRLISIQTCCVPRRQ
jgi:hypothetical protein